MCDDCQRSRIWDKRNDHCWNMLPRRAVKTLKYYHELFKNPTNLITNPKAVCSHSVTWQYVGLHYEQCSLVGCGEFFGRSSSTFRRTYCTNERQVAINKLCMCLVPAGHMTHFSTLKMEAALYSKRSMTFYQTARRHFPEENNLQKSECLYII